ncbi:hypothetical protein ACFYQ5_31280 [Streptomyces sp. NPDC005794]|uniref:hypothetical protein n=1 Tax=Streptomyces sp. NPDC005794 TaxID=3364733 RepID=UPI003699A18C
MHAVLNREGAATLAHEAMAIVRPLDDDLTEKRTLREAVSVLALAGQHLARGNPGRADELLGESESIAQRLPEQDRTYALKVVVRAQVAAGNAIAGTDPDRVDRVVRKSERLTRSLPDEDREFPLADMARALITTGEALVESDPDRAEGYAREAERIVRQIPERDHALGNIARLQAKLVKRRPAYADHARRTAESITDDLYKSIAVRDLVIALAPADTEQAERIAQNITNVSYRASALTAIAEARL